jgi:hypothetical protein
MQKLFRKDYTGEYIITGGNRVGGSVQYDRTWMPNTINNHNTGYAVVLGNGPSRAEAIPDTWVFYRHLGGLNASKKFTAYGCNAVFRDARVHFLIVNHPRIAAEVVEKGYADENIVLTSRRNIEAFPNKFHLIPNNPNWNAGATAAYLAAFDGHHTVYLTGIDLDNHPQNLNNQYASTNGYSHGTKEPNYARWIREFTEVFTSYPEVNFVRVARGNRSPIPEAWINLPNVSQISYDYFWKSTDLGIQGR